MSSEALASCWNGGYVRRSEAGGMSANIMGAALPGNVERAAHQRSIILERRVSCLIVSGACRGDIKLS